MDIFRHLTQDLYPYIDNGIESIKIKLISFGPEKR